MTDPSSPFLTVPVVAALLRVAPAPTDMTLAVAVLLTVDATGHG